MRRRLPGAAGAGCWPPPHTEYDGSPIGRARDLEKYSGVGPPVAEGIGWSSRAIGRDLLAGRKRAIVRRVETPNLASGLRTRTCQARYSGLVNSCRAFMVGDKAAAPARPHP